MEVAKTPTGFELITDKSMVYTPCAEAHVEMAVLKREPAALLTGKLDWYWRNEKGQACTSRVVADMDDMINAPNATENPEDSSVQAKRNTLQSLSIRDLEEECQILEKFVRSKQDARIPSFELRDQHPFNNQHLYWSKPDQNGMGGDAVDVIN